MPKVQRTPPPSSPSDNIPTHSQSEPDLVTLNEPDDVAHITSRIKRARVETPPGKKQKECTKEADQRSSPVSKQDLSDFKNELMMVLKSWREEDKSALTKLSEDVVDVKNRCAIIQQSNTEIESTVNCMKTQYEDVKTKIEKLEQENVEIKASLMTLDNQIQEYQQLSRSSAIEIRNVPNNNNETEGDLIEVIQKLSTTLNMEIKDHEVRDIYRRVGRPGSTKAIIVEFCTVQLKNNFIGAAQQWNKTKQGADKLNLSHIGRTSIAYVCKETRIPILLDFEG